MYYIAIKILYMYFFFLIISRCIISSTIIIIILIILLVAVNTLQEIILETVTIIDNLLFQ